MRYLGTDNVRLQILLSISIITWQTTREHDHGIADTHIGDLSQCAHTSISTTDENLSRLPTLIVSISYYYILLVLVFSL